MLFNYFCNGKYTFLHCSNSCISVVIKYRCCKQRKASHLKLKPIIDLLPIEVTQVVYSDGVARVDE